jgi:hypothetical protein
LRVRLLDNDRTLAFNNLRFHLLLFRRTQVALLLSFLAHALDSLHDIRLLSQKRVAKIGGPLNIIGQAVYHIGQGRQRLNTGIPRLFRHGISEFLVFEPFVFPEPLLKLDDFKGVCRCSQYLGQQWIRVESNRRHERIHLIRRYRRSCCLSGIGSGRGLGQRNSFSGSKQQSAHNGRNTSRNLPSRTGKLSDLHDFFDAILPASLTNGWWGQIDGKLTVRNASGLSGALY